MVNARACAYQCLPYNSSGIILVDTRTMQADSCLNFEQIDTLLISVGGQEGGLGGGVILGQRPKLTRDCHDLGGGAPGRRVHYFFIPNRDLL